MLITRVISLVLCASSIMCGNMGYRSELIYKCGAADEKKVALTFDDGPHSQYTQEIISILEEYSVKATFFVIGKNAEEYPDIVKKEAENGYEIGNHTYTHPKIPKISPLSLENEIEKGEDALFKITGERPAIFRPPGGFCNKDVGNIAAKKNYSIILWTVDTRDWEIPSTEKIIDTVKEKLRAGAIILFHDYVFGESNTPEALRTIVPYILSEGYEIVTISELLGL